MVKSFKDILTKTFLIEEYINKKKSSIKIAKELDINPQTILNYLKTYKVKIRALTEARIGYITTDETKRKLSESKKGEKNPNYNKSPSKEIREKISKARKNIPCSEETKGKMSEGKKEYYKNNPSERIKISERQTIKNILLEEENLIKEYVINQKSAIKISKEVGCDSGTIYRRLIKYGIPIRTISEANKGEKSALYGKIGIKSFNWKGGPKLSQARSDSKRREYGYIFLNTSFEKSVQHHIDKEHIIFIPEELHKSIPHALKRPESMEEINTKVYCWLLGMPIEYETK